MTERELHHGVVAIVTNAARTRFYLQQKDERYEPFPLGYSLFGGALEGHEDPAQALARELREELGQAAARLVDAGPRPVFARRAMADGYVVSVFEIVLEDPTLDVLAATPVLEGKRGAVVERDALEQLPFVWGLLDVVRDYLSVAGTTTSSS